MGRLVVVLTVVVAACTPPSAAPPDTAPPSVSSSVSTTPAAPSTTTTTTTTTSLPPTTTGPGTTTPATAASTSLPATTSPQSSGRYRGAVGFGTGLTADVFAPTDPGPYPVAVLVHGGGWVAGDRRSMWPLADALAGRGFVAYAVEYRTLARGGRFPETVDDVACAVRLARRDASRMTTTPDRVVLVGHSAGAHLSALVAYGGDEFGTTCPDSGPQDVIGFVGLAGPYDTDRLELVLGPFFGTRLVDDPAPWRRGNPFTYVRSGLDVPSLLIHGEADPVVPPLFTEELAAALEEVGTPVELRLLEGVDHSEVIDPDVVGDLIDEWVRGLAP